jgi:hypothetical protein
MIQVDPELLRPRLGRLCGWSEVNVVVPLNAGSVCGAGALVPMGQEGQCTRPRKQLMAPAMQVGSTGLYGGLRGSGVVFPNRWEQRRSEGWYRGRVVRDGMQCTVERLLFGAQVFWSAIRMCGWMLDRVVG